MIGGKWENGKIIYRMNSELYPRKDGYYEHDNKDVVDFVVNDFRIWKEQKDLSKEPGPYSFSFNKEHPSHVVIKKDKNGQYKTLNECIIAGYADRMEYWLYYDVPLNPVEEEIAYILATNFTEKNVAEHHEKTGSEEDYIIFDSKKDDLEKLDYGYHF